LDLSFNKFNETKRSNSKQMKIIKIELEKIKNILKNIINIMCSNSTLINDIGLDRTSTEKKKTDENIEIKKLF
jgi:hypothetical protein